MSAEGRRQITAIMEGLDRFTEKQVRDLTLEITANLIEDTPVDIGWARANWVPAIGHPAMVIQQDRPAPEDVPGMAARQSAGQGQIISYRLADGPTFVSNNTPYILVLNDGSSDQAPRGFVQTAVGRAVRTIQARY